MIATPVSNRPNSSRINGSTQSQSTGEESSIHSQTSTHSSTNTPTSASSYPSHQNQNQNHHHHVDHHRSRNHVPIRIRSIPVSQSCSPSRRNQIHSNSNNVNNNNENNDKNKNIVLLSPRRERSKLVIESSSRNLSLSKSYDMKRSTSVPTPTSNSSMLNHVYNPSNSSSQHQHHYQYQNQHHQYQYQNQHQHLHSFFSHTTPKIVSIPHQNQTLPSPFIPKQHFQLPLPSPSSLPQNDKNDFETETDIITSKYSCMNSFPNIKLNLNCANSMRPRLENGDASSPDSGAGARSDKKHNSGGKGKGKFKGNGEHKSDPNHSNTHPNIYMDPNDDDKSSVFSLTTPGNRWKAMSQLAGPHKQDSKVFDISHRTDLTPESLKYGVPPAVASQVLDLRCNEISRMMNLYQDDNDNDNENDSDYDYDYDGNDDSGEDYNLNVRDNFLSAQHPTHLFSPSKDRIKQDRHVKSFGQKIGFYSADLPKFIDVVEHLFPNLLHITFDPSKVKEEKQQHQQHQHPSLDEHETKTESETESNEANIDPSNSDTSIQQQPQPQKNLTNVQSNSKTNTTNTTSSPLFHNNLFPSLTSQNLEIAKREVNRMKRLYIIFRLPKLLSIDFEPITEEERQMARPAGPNGCKVKKEQWLTKALKDWDINDAMSKSNTHSHYMSPIHSPRHQHHNQRSETIESWESMSTGGIECTFPEKLPSLSNDDRDKMVKESLDQEKRHISEQDDGSQNPKSHVKSKRMFLSPKRKKSSPKVKKNDKHEKSNKMDTVEEEQDTDTILNDWNDAIKSPSSSLATAMNLRKSFPLSSEENSSQNNTLFIDVPTGRTYTKPSTSATASKEVLDPNFNSSAMTHTNANTNGTKPRFTNRRPPTSPASTLRPIPVTKTKGKAWSRRRWRKSSDSNKGGAGGVGGRPLASSASIADEEDGSSEEEEDDDNNDDLVHE